MTAYPTWTPASRPGIVPLQPLSFGTILGRSFTALRHNPRVLLGFALVVQAVTYIVLIVAVAGVAVAAFSRLDNVAAGSADYQTITAGSVAITIVAGFVLGLVAGAIGTIVQAVVVTEVAHAVVAERPTLATIWRQVRPVAWRLIGYALMLSFALVLGIALVAAAIFAVSLAAGPVAILLTILSVLAAIPLLIWLSVKLLLVPAVIILERATIRAAIVRSWTLIRGRFWSTVGIVVVIQVIFGVLAQLVSVPFSIVSALLGSVIAPTGDAGVTGMITMIVGIGVTEIVILLIQSVAVVVQATATSLIYVDCRMRHEGLDLDLLAYVERRDAGMPDLPDPYTQSIGRTVIRPRAPYPAYGAPYPTPPNPAPPSGAPYPTPPYPAPSSAPPPASPTWTAPGSAPAPRPGDPSDGSP